VELLAAWYLVWALTLPKQVSGLNLVKEQKMRNLIIGFILGVVVTTVGFSGIARMLDKGVQTIQTQSKELAQ